MRQARCCPRLPEVGQQSALSQRDAYSRFFVDLSVLGVLSGEKPVWDSVITHCGREAARLKSAAHSMESEIVLCHEFLGERPGEALPQTHEDLLVNLADA